MTLTTDEALKLEVALAEIFDGADVDPQFMDSNGGKALAVSPRLMASMETLRPAINEVAERAIGRKIIWAGTTHDAPGHDAIAFCNRDINHLADREKYDRKPGESFNAIG